MKNSFLRCLSVLASFSVLLSTNVAAENIEVGRVHQDCMWFTCYKSKIQSQVQGGNSYWDYIAEFNYRDDQCNGEHSHILPDFVEMEGLRYRVVSTFTFPGDQDLHVSNRMMEKLNFSAYEHLTELYIPEESRLLVHNLPNVEKLKCDWTPGGVMLYAPKLKSLNCMANVVSRGMSSSNESLTDRDREILGRHEGFNHLRVATLTSVRNPNDLEITFEDCPELSTLILAYTEPPQYPESLFRYDEMNCHRDENGRRYYLHPGRSQEGPYPCLMAGPNEKVYVVEIPEKTLVVPVGSLEKYKNAPGWSDFGKIVEGVDFEGIPLLPAWRGRWLTSVIESEKPYWIHSDDWKEWELLLDSDIVQLESLEWKDAPYFIQNGMIYWRNIDGEAEIVGPIDTSSSSYIFSDFVEYEGRRMPVRKIRGCAFANFKNLNKDAVPSTVEEIGNYAFYNAGLDPKFNNYNKVAPILCNFENIRKVGRYAFKGCSLSSDWAQSYLYSYLPKPSLEWIGNGAFRDVDFYNLGSRSWNIILPQSIRHIGREAFLYGYQSLRPRSIKLPENLDYIGRNAFEWGASLDLTDYTAETIPYELFGGSGYVSSASSICPTNPIVIPESVRIIEGRSGDNSDTSTTRRSAKISLGSNVESVQPYAFTLKPDGDGKCRIFVHAQTPPLVWDESFIRRSGDDFKVEIHVPVGSGSRYLQAGWVNFGDLIDDLEIREIDYEPFTLALNMADKTASLIHTDVTKYKDLSDDPTILRIPGTVTYAGEDFAVKTIGSWATGEPSNYHAWSTIVVPETVENIEPYAFPFSFNSNVRNATLVCHAMTPPNIEAEHSFGWPFPVDRFESSSSKYGDLYVNDEAAETYGNHKQFNTLFRVLPMSNLPTGIAQLYNSDLDIAQPLEVYTIDGLILKTNVKGLTTLPGGLYILRQGIKSIKVRL